MFDESRCDFCGLCLAGCKFVDFDETTGGEAIKALVRGETPGWLNACATCFACQETCPNKARPFDLICQRQEEKGGYVAQEIFDGLYNHFAARGDFTAPQVDGRAVSVCTIYNVAPGPFSGLLWDGLPLLRGRFYFCNVLYMHLGNFSVVNDEMENVIGRLAATGAGEIVFVHDDCWAMIEMAKERGLEIPFRAMHLFEHLAEKLKAHRDKIKPLGMTIAFQRPCASRYSPGKEPLLDEIFELIGVTRAAREYDRENCLCCSENTAGAIPARTGIERFKDLNVEDARKHGATAMVFLCPMCINALKPKCEEAGLATIFLPDLCRMALGEAPAPNNG